VEEVWQGKVSDAIIGLTPIHTPNFAIKNVKEKLVMINTFWEHKKKRKI
jgi:hypothetical protein